jgi:two-component sensor histidine kinase
MIRIEIEDNGIGINESKKMNAGKARRSFGIELTIDRLRLFGKNMEEKQKSGWLIFQKTTV